MVGFEHKWEAAWNAHDLNRILSHYTDNIEFRSRKAVALVGTGLILGKPALRKYWEAALAQQPALRFKVKDVFRGHEMMVITYTNHKSVEAAETLYFDAAGKIYRAAASHATPT